MDPRESELVPELTVERRCASPMGPKAKGQRAQGAFGASDGHEIDCTHPGSLSELQAILNGSYFE